MSDIVESLEHQLDEFDSGKAIHFDYSGLRALIAEIRCLREENATLRLTNLAALEARGMVVVPKEATNKMIDAGGYALQEYADLTMDAAKAAWPAMLAARPEQE